MSFAEKAVDTLKYAKNKEVGTYQYARNKTVGTYQYAKEKYNNTFYDKNIMSDQYPILSDYKINTFYDSIFLKRIQNVINNAENEYVKTSMIINNGKSIKIQKKRIVNDYIVPLSYLIYSFIYTKYYNYQLKNQMIVENKLYYSMFGYVFKHNNPVIKKVNVNLYNYFKNEDLSGTSEIKLKIIVDKKEAIVTFLDSTVIPKMKEENNYDFLLDKYDNIMDNFNKIILDIGKLSKLFREIEIKTKANTIDNSKSIKIFKKKSDNTYVNSIIDPAIVKYRNTKTYNFRQELSNIIAYNSHDVNLFSIFDSISIEKTKSEFKLYEEYYDKGLNIYKNILKKIQLINIEIIELNNDESLIEDDDINLVKIFELYNKYYLKHNEIIQNKEKEDEDIVKIEKIKLNINQKIDIYNELLSNNTFNKNNNNIKKNKINVYVGEIEKINNEINSNINSIIRITPASTSTSTPASTSTSTPTSTHTSTHTSTPTTTPTSTPNNVNFNTLLNKFLESFKINENIEFKYINTIFKKTNNKLENKEKTNKLENEKKTTKDIEKNKTNFNSLFREYKKLHNDENNEYIKYLKKKERDNNIQLEDIEILIESSSTVNKFSNNSNSLKTKEEAISEKQKTLKTIESEKINYETTYTKIKTIKNAIGINNIISNLNEIINEINVYVRNKINPAPPPPNVLNIINPSIKDMNDLKDNIKKTLNTITNYSSKLKNKREIEGFINKIKTNINNYATPEFNKLQQEYLKTLGQSDQKNFQDKIFFDRLLIIDKYYKDYLTSKNTEFTTLNKNINLLKDERDNLKAIIKLKKYRSEMYTQTKTDLDRLSKSIKEKINKLELESSSKSINTINKDLKDNFNKEFDNIITLSKEYETVIQNKNYKKTNNKLLNYYNRNNIFIEIINKIKNEKTNERNPNSNKKITNELSNYFYNNDSFIDKLNIFSKDFKDENVKLFFKQYQEFYNILKNKKIKLLLNKINNGIIKYNDSNNNNFIKGIKPKIEYYDKIKNYGEPSNNEFKDKKGKYTQVLPYTDIMFLYFIDLLIIIDYLTFYYE